MFLRFANLFLMPFLFEADGNQSGNTDDEDITNPNNSGDQKPEDNTEGKTGDKGNTEEPKKEEELSYEDLVEKFEKDEDSLTIEEHEKLNDYLLTDSSESEDDIQKPDSKEKQPESFIITDEYIEKEQDEFNKSILVKLKGQPWNPQGLKNYLHSQKYIEDLKNNKVNPSDDIDPNDYQPGSTQDSNVKIPDSKEILSKTDDKGRKLIDETAYKLAATQLQRKYPDFEESMFTDPDELKVFQRMLNDDDPAAFQQFNQDFHGVVNRTKDIVAKEMDLEQNWAKYLDTQIKVDTQKFINWLEKERGLKPEDIGFVNPVSDETIEKHISINGSYDPKLFNAYKTTLNERQILLLSPGDYFRKLKDHFEGTIYQKAIEKARGDGFQKANDRKSRKMDPGSLSDMGGGASKREIKPEVDNDTLITDDMSIEQGEAILEKQLKSE